MMAGGEGGVKIFISFIHLGLGTISIFDLTLYTLVVFSSNKQTLQPRGAPQTGLNPLYFQPRQ